MATVAEFPALSWLDIDRQQVEQGLLDLVSEVIEDMDASGGTIPKPLGTRIYSGKFNVRTSSLLHRWLAMAAKAEGVSLNTLINQKLASA